MIDDRKRELKKFLHDYSFAIIATILLFAIVLFLVLSRHFSLMSVEDLSKINPLITSEQNELVATTDSDAVIKIIKEAEGGDPTPAQTKSPGVTKTQAPKPSSGGGQTKAPSSSGGGGGGSSTPAPQPFLAGIGQVRHYGSGGSSLLGVCTINHLFEADIVSVNAPGKVTYQWSRNDGKVEAVQTVNIQSDTPKTVTYSWSISAGTSNRSVTLEILTPNKSEETLTFQHSCSLLKL